MDEPSPESPTLDTRALQRHLDPLLPGGVDGGLHATLLAGGRSNPTYELRDASRAWVLRRPPFGSVLPTAHDMGREHRVISALGDTDVPVPRTVAYCDDPEVIGAPFYVMEKLEGRTLSTPEDTQALDPDQRARLGETLIQTLAALHEVDPTQVGLAAFGRPSGYLQRQVATWRKQWRASATAPRPEVDELLDRLERTVPETRHPGIVHGDFKLDNLMVASDDPTRVIGLLDWEMATLGDTLTDLGVLLSFWDRPDAPFHPLTDGITALDGFPSRAQLVERYIGLRAIEPPELEWYVIFADVKIAVIFEGIHARHLRGETVGTGFEGIGDMVGRVLERAMDGALLESLPSSSRAGRSDGPPKEVRA